MDSAIENIIAQALQMPPKERATVAERLISSLDTEYDQDVEVAWQKEAQRRVKEIDDNKVACMPWEEVLQRLRGNSRAKD